MDKAPPPIDALGIGQQKILKAAELRRDVGLVVTVMKHVPEDRHAEMFAKMLLELQRLLQVYDA